MQIKPIRSTADHLAALQEIETLMDAKWGTPEGDRLDVLTTLVQFWEQQHFIPLESLIKEYEPVDA